MYKISDKESSQAPNLSGSEVKIDKILESSDGSFKYVFRTEDMFKVEGVYFPYRGLIGRKYEPQVVCLSCATGCPIGCEFCATGRIKEYRNLTAAEMLSEFSCINGDVTSKGMKPINLIVMMGMGEPLLNLDNILKFSQQIEFASQDKLPFAVSTSGIIPGIVRLRSLDVDWKLHLSVHSPFDEQRSQIMPINKAYPIIQVVEECRAFSITKGQTVDANYTLIADLNDTEAHAVAFAKLLNRENFEVKLNAWNEIPDSNFKRPNEEKLRHFKTVLESFGYVVDIQLSKATDIAGGCGQLATT